MIRVEHTPSSALRCGDWRLDGSFYCSDGARARRFLISRSIKTEPLESLCVENGLYIPPRFKRPYVRDPAYGAAYITGSSIGQDEPTHGCAYLSNRAGLIRNRGVLMFRPETIVVTCSGDPGKAVYVNELFQGAIGSPDLLRVVPNTRLVRPGYLYAFLASEMGRGLLTQSVYGGVIPHIEAFHAADIPIPRLGASAEQGIHECVGQAASNRAEANRLLAKAQEQVYKVTGLPRLEEAPFGRNLDGMRAFSVSQSSLGDRLEARFHDLLVRDMRDRIQQAGDFARLSCITRSVHEEHRHKLFNAEVNCLPFIGSGEMFAARPQPHRHVSRRIPGIDSLVVQPGTILIAKSGQIYSILGDSVLVGRTLAKMAVSWHALRVIPDPSAVHPGFLFAFLSLPDYGYGQVVATAYGTSIPEISTEHVKQVLVPMPKREARDAIGTQVLRAIELRDQANDLEDEAQEILQASLEDAAGR